MLSESVQAYIDMRRACGYKFHHEAKSLQNFVQFCSSRNEDYVRSSTAIEWAGLARQTVQRAHRLAVVVRFSRYARSDDSRHEVPPDIFGPDKRQRPVPYILSQEEVARLIQEAARFGSHPMQGKTYSTLFGLLVCTGLRISEAINLRYSDVTQDGLMIRNTKFRKSRLVPLHGSARVALESYLTQRRVFETLDDHVFISSNANPLNPSDVSHVFRNLAQCIGIPRGPGLPRAMTHSLRHTFAVASLQACPDGRDQIARHMLALSTYLGHVSVATTYWYLQATPQLMQGIATQCETFVGAAK